MSNMKPKFRSSSKKEKRKVIILGIIVALVITAGIVWVFITINKQGQDVANAMIAKEPEKVMVYKAQEDLKAGTLVYIGDFYAEESDQIPGDAVTSEIAMEGQRIKKDIKKDEILQLSKITPKNAWYEEGDRYIEYTFLDGIIPQLYAGGLIGTFADITLYTGSEEDPIVAAKIPIIAENGNRLAFYCNKNEADYINDASKIGDFKIRIYLDDTQKASDVTYIPSYERSGGNDENNSGLQSN